MPAIIALLLFTYFVALLKAPVDSNEEGCNTL
jgi:hypothetical protein